MPCTLGHIDKSEVNAALRDTQRFLEVIADVIEG